jgi:hypothetical protein
MAPSPAVLEARIHCRVCELQVLAAQTAVDWGAQARERELAKKSRDPFVRQLAGALLDASKMTLDEACKTDFERLAVEKELKLLECAAKIANFKRR